MVVYSSWLLDEVSKWLGNFDNEHSLHPWLQLAFSLSTSSLSKSTITTNSSRVGIPHDLVTMKSRRYIAYMYLDPVLYRL
jgi:hypothetical protein